MTEISSQFRDRLTRGMVESSRLIKLPDGQFKRDNIQEEVNQVHIMATNAPKDTIPPNVLSRMLAIQCPRRVLRI
jgi:hypothetical protein